MLYSIYDAFDIGITRSAYKIYNEEAKITKWDWMFLFLRGCIGATNNIIIIYSLQVSNAFTVSKNLLS